MNMLQNLPKNVGPMDRNIRLIAAGALILAGLITGSVILDIIGLIVLATGAIGFCPAYTLFKVNTNKQDAA
ncbi:MAG: YgaP family membrane protein [Thermochromatium sp.]